MRFQDLYNDIHTQNNALLVAHMRTLKKGGMLEV